MVNGDRPGMMPGPAQQGPQITEAMVKDTEPIPCAKCGCTIWCQDDTHHQVKKISGLVIGQSMDVYVFPAARYCAKCFEPIPDQP